MCYTISGILTYIFIFAVNGEEKAAVSNGAGIQVEGVVSEKVMQKSSTHMEGVL